MKTLALFLALTCSVPAMANQAEACEGTVLSAAQFEFAGTVVPLLKTLRPDGVLCQEYVSSTETYQTLDGTQKVQIPKGVLCDNAPARRAALSRANVPGRPGAPCAPQMAGTMHRPDALAPVEADAAK